ncbi:hypothetical protein HanXRQr2_Chr16g0728211 [Helianthus annuus]|uniref:Uncharacterized protein n=1 Tax=Helianthus annuus TaxID=4232 RepID=A0A9K3GYL0_HELAN|nr:hypothetical protein HanXRQr2_Chr16g0728211 [Helianthus annuus]
MHTYIRYIMQEVALHLSTSPKATIKCPIHNCSAKMLLACAFYINTIFKTYDLTYWLNRNFI